MDSIIMLISAALTVFWWYELVQGLDADFNLV